MPYIDTPKGVRLYYETYGQGRPIVFIHPPLTGHVIFKYQKKLDKNFQIILYDLRGHGKSGYLPSQSEDRVFPDHLDDLKALIEGLKLENPVVAGYSAGGQLALSYALAYTERVSALVLSGGYPAIDSQLLAWEYQIGIILIRTKKKNVLSNILAKSHKVTEADIKMLYTYAMKANDDAVLDLYVTGKRYNAVEQLPRLNRLPTLILYGTRDKFISKHKKYFEILTKTKIIFIDRAFHQLPTHQHEEFNQALTQFLKEI
ncbi:alpha/beta fold hydrolase [Sporolactobacillus putidus]|uniref:AB hydrolase superfamily protein YvaM n=1 Tax=Sporolactobacillus putidus TaxID=492735 RepID=A0A917S1F5_9BACL|nr:alpha/beta hydrolase [Sporolactobacillus putidus]GGL48671.1 AB hydrolase superfamily protein YvaM [Sporolactobacillus putidus]